MSVPAAVRSAAGRIPGWSNASATALSSGTTGSAWLLERDGALGVLKLDIGPRDPALNSRPDEARIQQTAHAAGIAPAVLYAGEGLLLCAYAPGHALDTVAGAAGRCVEALADALRCMHALPPTGRNFDGRGAARRYADLALKAGNDPQHIAHCMKQVLEAPAPDVRRCCHNDLVPGNIIAGETLQFIDWEFACDNDPLFDLATIVHEFGLSRHEQARLLDAYFDGDGQRWYVRLMAQLCAYEALTLLWHMSR